MRRDHLRAVLERLAPLPGNPDHYATHVVESIEVPGPITRPGYGCVPWLYDDPAEALEVFETAGLSPGIDPRRRWYPCRGCGGDRAGCSECDRTGAGRHPPDMATAVAVASLGPMDWVRAEELARTVEPEVAWRVMSRREISAHVAAASLAVSQEPVVVWRAR